jgi:hypothetical protein
MMTRNLRSWIGLALATASLTACEGAAPAIDEKVVTQQAALHAQAVMHVSGTALAFTIADNGTVTKIMGSTTSTANTVVAPMLSAGMPPTAMLRAMVGPGLTQQMSGLQMPSMMTTEERFDDTGDEIKRLMSERLFVDANFESKADGTATYLLHGDPTCRPLTQDTDPPDFVPAIDQKCADDFAKVEVRVAVKADGDGARMTVLIGTDRLELIAVIIHSDEIAAEIDLPKAKAASDVIQQKVGDGNPTGTYERLAGTLRASLKKVGAEKVTASFGILKALDIEQTSSSPSVTIVATNPVIALTSDGASKSANLEMGLGTTEIATTWDPHGTGVANHDTHVVIGGLYGELALDDSAKQILFTDMGIGESSVKVRGVSIFDLNLNADSMRRFSGKVSVDGAGISRLEITPKFDLSLGFDYNAVASDFSSPPDASLAHETYGVLLANGGTSTIIEEVPSTATFAGGIKLVQGTLTLKAESVPNETVTVAAGSCLVSVDTVPPGKQPILGKFASVACP